MLTINPETIGFVLVLGHLVGLALGFGGAMVSDVVFLSSIRDKKIIKTEMGFIVLGGSLVWSGLLILMLSGLGLFLTDPLVYLASSKFIVKMLIVFVIAANGLVMHGIHLPWLKKNQGKKINKVRHYANRRIYLIVSGAISGSSWLSALILGASDEVSLFIWQILGLYLVFVLFSIATAYALRNVLFPALKR